MLPDPATYPGAPFTRAFAREWDVAASPDPSTSPGAPFTRAFAREWDVAVSPDPAHDKSPRVRGTRVFAPAELHHAA